MWKQCIINSIVRASELALLGVGLTLTFDLLQFANFAHLTLAVIGAYFALIFAQTLGVNLFLAIVIGALFTGLAAIVIDWLTFKRLRAESDITLMILSMGLSIALRNLVRFIWGPDIHSLTTFGKPYHILGTFVMRSQITIVIVGLVAMVGIHFLLNNTTLGRAMRATSENRDLARASGIPAERVIKWTWFIGGALAGLGGALIGWETQVYPFMGFDIIIPVFCAILLGGLGNPYGAMLGALLLGFGENFLVFVNFGPLINLGGLLNVTDGVTTIPIEYKIAISFFILIGVLLLRPSGLLGRGLE